MDTDSELMELVAADDKAAFETLVNRYENRLKAFIRRFVQDAGACEEIAEDTFVSLWMHRKTYRREAAFETYLFAVAKHRCLDYIKSHRNDGIRLPDTDKTEISAEDEFLQKEFGQRLLAEIEKLRQKDGDCFYLFAVKGLPVRSIAKKLGISEALVRVKVFRTRAKLRKLFEKEGLM